MPKIIFNFGFLFIILFLNSCQKEVQAQESDLFSKDSLQEKWVNSTYDSLSLEEKVGQLFIVAAYSNQDAQHENQIKALIQKEHIGGLIFMQDDAQKQARLTNEYQKLSKVPLLIGMDAEWGLAMRLKNTHKFPYAMTLGAIQSDSLLYQVGNKIAQHCKRLGVHWNFAPVVDVNTNPNNPIIGNRSFGSDVQNVTTKASSYMHGMQDNFVLASAKHFPGHGDTSSDSHKTLPIVNHSRDRLDSIELAPYKALIKNGLSGVMVAHLDVPYLDSRNVPSSLSDSIIIHTLQEELGFEGLVITDALNMQGVASKYPPGIVDVKAFEAGNDVLLFSQDVAKAKSEIIKAIQKGSISEERLEKSVKKILRAKYWTGIQTKVALEDLEKDLNDAESDALNDMLYAHAITLVKNTNNAIPFEDTTIQYQIKNFRESGSLFKQTAQKYAPIKTVQSVQQINAKEPLIINVFMDTSTPYKKYSLTAEELQFIQTAAQKTTTYVVVYGSPYSLKNIKTNSVAGIVITYENNEDTQRLVPQILFGARPAKGKLPVDVSSEIQSGMGVETQPLGKLGYAVPEEVGMDSKELAKIDSIAQKSIDKMETPGIQVLVGRKGKIVYQKNFGYQTYKKKVPITDSTIYDLASVTKILATTPLIMSLYEKGTIDLDKPIAYYWKEAYHTNKEKLTIRDILTHQAGLKAWIPFYKETIGETNKKELYYSKSLTTQNTIEVFQGMYGYKHMKDTILQQILDSPLESKNYRYSDLGFYILQQIIEKQYRADLDEIVFHKINKPLYAKTLGFNPYKTHPIETIAPTEEDAYFRKTTIQGYVHDQGAAMMGGVAGHAGLFGCAEDVAKLLQLYLNGGSYGGKEFLKPKTLQLFTDYQFKERENRRALGFDKQLKDEGPFCDCVSEEGFGHTGFTGTMVWVDPVKELIYVFLSNRTYPDANTNLLHKNKTRVKIQEVIYNALRD